ncbi:Dipeptidyl-peptidase 5 [Smittium culicis]|uniref:Dipeptidyl-peptidase V n=1 Tax=Smittium culicis TaxID=133412 RepID=A0A1R1XTG7_9FUNG|nr:Dipeptidyl-peptidase 5 [Smittium culicis]
MKLTRFTLISVLVAVSVADVFNPDPSQFPDWGKYEKFNPDHYVQLKRLDSPSLSPDKSKVVYSQYQYNKDDDSSGKNLRVFDLQSGYESVVDLTEYKYKLSDSSPVWVDSNTIAFTAVRGSPESNIFTVSTVDKKISQITNFTNGVYDIIYSKKASMFAFISKVYKGMDLEQSSAERMRIADLPSSGIVFDKLFVRRWNEWILKDRYQLFTIKASNNNGVLKTSGEPVNIVAKYSGEWGLEPDFYQFSPDGKRILFSAKIQGKEEAWQTDAGIFEAPVDGSSEPVRLNSNFNGAGSNPIYSPDGKSIVWLQMATRGYEADQNQVILYDIVSKKQTRLIPNWDRSPSTIDFSEDSLKLFMQVPYEKDVALFELIISNNTINRLTKDGTATFVSQIDNDSMLISVNTLQHPTALFTLKKSSSGDYQPKQITFENKKALDKFWFSKTETFWFTGALDEPVQAMLLYPHGFDPNCKYPVFYLIHGGPQASWNDGWSWRWNPNLYANQGFLVVIVNFHGGDAYGQAFTDSIRYNSGSYPYEDLMKGLDVLIHNAPFVDENNVVGVGASYGGYMINWLNGQTDRFKAFVNHNGVFNSIGTYYMTDELYFDEFGSGIPWVPADREIFEKYNPERYVANWKTPTLIIHSENDYRIPISEGLSAFTVLQRKGIDSKYLYFPDEDHWINTPHNVLKWISEILDWTGTYTNTTVWSLE